MLWFYPTPPTPRCPSNRGKPKPSPKTGTGVAGNFEPSLYLTNPAGKLTLGSAKIAGNLLSDTWNINGNAGAVFVGGTVEGDADTPSTISATGSFASLSVGAAKNVDFLAGLVALAGRRPEQFDDFESLASAIKSFTVRGLPVAKGDPVPAFFANCNVAAAQLGKMTLRNIDYASGSEPFGLTARGADGIASIKYKETRPGLAGWSWPLKPDQTLPSGNFEIVTI